MISGKFFAQQCHWVFDPRYPEMRRFSYVHANHGDWVFVNGDYLQQFRAQCPLFSPKKFYIIVHNTDRPFGFPEVNLLRILSIHIYAINTTITHPDVTTIPLGFVDRQLPFLESFVRPECERDIEIYANFTQTTNDAKRQACILAVKDNPLVTWKTGLTVTEYYADLCRAKFVLCPEGTGMDTHRVYESLFCGATPVVLRNSLAHLYEKLPVCIVNSWTDVYTQPSQKTDIRTFLKNLPERP